MNYNSNNVSTDTLIIKQPINDVSSGQRITHKEVIVADDLKKYN